MKQGKTAQGIVIFAAALLAALALAALPAASTAQTNANTSKAGARSASTPTATRQDNSNKAARPTSQKSAAVAPNAEVKEDPGKMTYTRVPHQYVIEESDTGHPYTVYFNVRNVGKGAARAGKVSGTFVYLEDGPDPRNSKVAWEPRYLASGGAAKLQMVRWGASVVLRALRPGESARVRLYFGPLPGIPANPPDFPIEKKVRAGVSLSASNGQTMADGKDRASLNDFMSAAFFAK